MLLQQPKKNTDEGLKFVGILLHNKKDLFCLMGDVGLMVFKKIKRRKDIWMTSEREKKRERERVRVQVQSFSSLE